MRKALTFYVSRITPVADSFNVDLAIRNPNPDPNPIYIADAKKQRTRVDALL